MQKIHDDYVLDIPYTWEFFDVQNPTHLSYIANSRGIRAPAVNKAFTYCELGCGNGLTSNLIAAALPHGDFYAVDFNPEHIKNAEHLAQQGELENIKFLCCDFAALLKRDDIPGMDFITLHGVYSWVSQEIRTQVLSVIDALLKPGGLLYVSYNPLPKWSEITPMWRMMLEHIKPMQADSISKAKEGLRYLAHLRENNLQYMRTNIGASHFLDELLQRDIRFVAHEFCNNYLEPQYFCDVAEAMAGIGLDYCCSADSENNELFIPRKLLGYVEGETSKIRRESRKSLLSNEFFRRDIYIRGDGSDSTDETIQLSVMGDWVISSPYTDVQLQRVFPAYKSDVRLQGKIYATIMNNAYQGQLTVAELCTHEALDAYPPNEIIKAIHTLVETEHLEILVNKPAVQHTLPTNAKQYRLTHPINSYLLENRLLKDGQCQLVSPMCGVITQLDLLTGLCLLATLKTSETDSVEFISKQLTEFAEQYPGHAGLPEQKKLTNITWMKGEWQKFKSNNLPMLLYYQILR